MDQQVLIPNNDAFDRIKYGHPLHDIFDRKDNYSIENVLDYHILQGARTAAQLVPGTPAFIPTMLDDTKFTNVTGGQVVENIKQGGDTVIIVSGRGERSTVLETVSSLRWVST